MINHGFFCGRGFFLWNIKSKKMMDTSAIFWMIWNAQFQGMYLPWQDYPAPEKEWLYEVFPETVPEAGSHLSRHVESGDF
jgi:hypothetical protein